MSDWVWLAAGWCVVLSVVSLAQYGIDKSRARNGGRRISERTLLLTALAGGWPGAFIGSRLFRHKTQKLTYRVIYWLIVVAHVVLWIVVATK